MCFQSIAELQHRKGHYCPHLPLAFVVSPFNVPEFHSNILFFPKIDHQGQSLLDGPGVSGSLSSRCMLSRIPLVAVAVMAIAAACYSGKHEPTSDSYHVPLNPKRTEYRAKSHFACLLGATKNKSGFLFLFRDRCVKDPITQTGFFGVHLNSKFETSQAVLHDVNHSKRPLLLTS
ncbi:hypothetical protein BC826DRAFT_1010280 [Russula brevipes]|nr:hypothetical protein BC826DRAFT_1010280 [Russula brevipes]